MAKKKGTKVCTKCGRSKPLSNFDASGKRVWCKTCVKTYNVAYRRKNKDRAASERKKYRKMHAEEVAAYSRMYRALHEEEIAEYSRRYDRKYYLENKECMLQQSRKWYKDNKGLVNASVAHKRKTDPLFKLAHTLRNRVRCWLKLASRPKEYRLSEYLGCTLGELKAHLEKQFQPGMTWDNHTTDGWHVDHIVPLSSAKTTKEMYRLSHYTNLQPLWWWQNLSKGDN